MMGIWAFFARDIYLSFVKRDREALEAYYDKYLGLFVFAWWTYFLLGLTEPRPFSNSLNFIVACLWTFVWRNRNKGRKKKLGERALGVVRNAGHKLVVVPIKD